MPDASRYVMSSCGTLVCISDVDAADRYAHGPYSCLACGHIMVPALGRVRKHHFKHKAGRPADCLHETYLHQLAKKILYEAISGAMVAGQQYPLIRSRDIVCDHYAEPHGITCTNQQLPFPEDLAARYDRIDIEKGVNGFVADILLSSIATGETILLEIVVTHHCDDAKIASGLAIVEIMIRNEDDIEQLKRGLDATSGSVQYHNATPLSPIHQNCTAPCGASGLALLLYRNGKAWYSEVPLGADGYITSDPQLETYEVVDPKIGRGNRNWSTIKASLGEFIIRQAYDAGKFVRSCMLCQHNGGRANDNDIYCMAKGCKMWMSSSATTCDAYFPPPTSDDARELLKL